MIKAKREKEVHKLVLNNLWTFIFILSMKA